MEGNKLYVGNLSYSVTNEQLQKLFSPHGQVQTANVIGDKGFGFVEMTNETEGKNAIEQLNGAEIEGRTIVVNEAIEKQDNFKKRDNAAPRRDNFRKSY